jgi:chromosome segregation ATPase
MDLEQLIKRVEWLDDAQRKDQTHITALENRLASLEGGISPFDKQIKDINGEITRLAAMLARMDHFDDSLLQQRVEARQSLEELEKQVKKREEETEKVRRVEMRALDASLVDLRKELAPIPELKRALQARVEEEARLGRGIDEVRLKIETVRRSEEEYTRSYRLLDDGRRQDSKRLTDLQGEITAMRKHVDDQRGKSELVSSTLRKIETRLNEISVLEVERREMQAKFLESQAMTQVERDRVWKDWQARFETIEGQTADIATNLQTLDATHRAVKRSQQTVDEVGAKVERRMNEMTEIQRLAEERFRQEWVTFKADDQKRWTNYTLTQEEQRGESVRQYDKLSDRVTQIEDSLQEIQDMLGQINEQTEKRLQSLLAVVHEWVSSFERSISRTR